MKKTFLPTISHTILCVISCGLAISSIAQQNIIADKDNTHPEIGRQNLRLPSIIQFTVQKDGDHNIITWQAAREADASTYIIEYSTNGVDYSAVGEVLANRSGTDRLYNITHYTRDSRPLLYRIRMRQLNGGVYSLATTMADGKASVPVKIFPTAVTSNILNANAALPVQRIAIYSGNGALMLARDLNGKQDFITIDIPSSFAQGMYLITFYGEGWQTTEKFFISS